MLLGPACGTYDHEQHVCYVLCAVQSSCTTIELSWLHAGYLTRNIFAPAFGVSSHAGVAVAPDVFAVPRSTRAYCRRHDLAAAVPTSSNIQLYRQITM